MDLCKKPFFTNTNFAGFLLLNKLEGGDNKVLEVGPGIGCSWAPTTHETKGCGLNRQPRVMVPMTTGEKMVLLVTTE